MSQRLNPIGRITGPGPNAMQCGDYGPWNVARVCPSPIPCKQTIYHEGVRATLPSALNVINASSVGKLVQLVTASRLILYHEG